jgi:hypothetical protein
VSLNGEKQGRFRNPLPIHQLRLEKSAKGQIEVVKKALAKARNERRAGC